MTTSPLDRVTLNIAQEIHVRASLATTFDALLEQMGPANQTADGTPMPMIIEARPGGRWFRDLGNDDGHFWGHVQAIKRPTLFEIHGPLFMSAAVVSNVQYRLKEAEGGTLVILRHTAFGFVPDEYRDRIAPGWTSLMQRTQQRAEAKR